MNRKNFLVLLAGLCVLVSTPTKSFAYGSESELTRLINEGITYHNNRNYIQAIKSFTKALSYDPGNQDILENLSITHNNYGKYLAERTDSEGAAREFRNALYYDVNNQIARTNLKAKLKALKLSSDDPNLRLEYAAKERKKGNLFAAIAEAKEANSIKETVEGYLEIGEVYHVLYLKTGRRKVYVKKSIDSLTMAQQLDPDDVRPLIKLGDVYVAKNEINKGIDYYKDAISLEPDNRLAQDALVNGWLAALRIAPHVASNHVGLATAYQLQGNFSQAERGFRRALELDPGNGLAKDGIASLRVDRIKTQTNLFLDRALKLQRSGKYDAALSEYIKALNLDPNNADIHYNIGTAFQAKKDFIRAEKAYRRTLSLREGDKDAEQALDSLLSMKEEQAVKKGFDHAIKLQQAGNLEEAIKVYIAISKDRPDDETVYYNLGTAYQALGNLELAVENYQKALKLNPEESTYSDAINATKLEQANRYLSEGIEKQTNGDNEAAIISYEKVVDLFPDNAGAWYNLGTAYQAVGKKSPALEAYKQAYLIDEDKQSDAIFFAALLLEEDRKLLEAVELYDKYLQIDPKGNYASESKERQEYIKSFLQKITA